MTFREFIARTESKDFDLIDERGNRFADLALNELWKDIGNAEHDGDCVKRSSPCMLCTLSELIVQFKEFTVNPEKYMEENGI